MAVSRRPRLSVLSILLLLATLATASLTAQEAAWPLDGPAFSASPQELQEAAAKVPVEQFVEATVLFERDIYTIAPSGAVTIRHSLLYRIDNQSAIEGWSETSERWDPWYQSEPEIRARVILPNGLVSQLDPKTITDGPAREGDDDTYTDERIRKAPLPGLAVGAIVEEETVLTDKSPFFSGGGVYRRYFSRGVPVVRSQLTLEAPVEMKLLTATHLLPKVLVTDSKQNGVHRMTFDQGYLAAEVDPDIDLPTREVASALVEFSTGESWAAVAAAYRALAEPRIVPDAVRAMLPKETGLSRLQLIQRLVARLHKDIRYTGIEFGQAALQPETPAEVLKRHYGDCKDKSALLVSMLRAAGIPANLVLLDTGPGPDVNPDLPGMNEFDHAIVYVPGETPKDAPIWIDATAEYAQVGHLPSMDHGRRALIIAENTTGLTMTPTATPADNSLVEEREITLPVFGPGHIVETSYTAGDIDEQYRADFGVGETRESRTNLENYAKDEYLAKALTKIEHGEGTDLAHPFQLKLDIAEGKRANTGIDDAAVAIPYAGLFVQLPEWFRKDPQADTDKLTPQQQEDQRRAVAARPATFEVAPFSAEWRYHITLPEGFELRALPDDKTTAMGPATLSQHFEKGADGAVVAALKFVTDKPTYTLSEALALREAILAAYKQDMLMVMFDQVGARLLAQGKIREALAADGALIAAHPAEPLHHVQLAYALLQAGLGDRARTQAEQATKLDPKSANAYRALAWVCEFSAIGVQYARGFDWECSRKAFERARELDPDDANTRLNLALIEEYNANGERYGEGALLKDAVREYRELAEKDKETADQYKDNLLYDLLYSGQYTELQAELDKLPSSVTRDGISIAGAVGKQPGQAGIAAGIARADHLSAGAQIRNQALATAGAMLMRMRLYEEAAGILAASVEGNANAAAVTQQIEMYRNLKPWKGFSQPANSAAGVVERMLLGLMSGKYDEKQNAELLSRHAYATDEDWQRNYRKMIRSAGVVHFYAIQAGLPEQVVMDLLAGNFKFNAEGDDASGYKVSVQALGAPEQQLFVSHEDVGFRIVTDSKSPSEVGNAVLYMLSKGKETEARSLLDWTRDQSHRGGGDDQLSGPLLPRFWTTGETTSREAMELAAAAELASTPAIAPKLPELRTAWEKATDEEMKTSLALLLANGYVAARDGVNARAMAGELLKKYPDSNTALELAGAADVLTKTLDDWSALLDKRQKTHPRDETLLRIRSELAEWQGDFAASRAARQQIIDIGKANANDFNGYAWTALFDGKIDDQVVKNAQQANLLTKNSSFAEMHTLACIYAATGKTKESRELLLKAMTAANMSEPESEVWFGLALLDEQYGIPDAAIEAFRKVEKPEGIVGPSSTWVAAQNHLKALGAGEAKP